MQNYFTKVLEDNIKAIIKPQYVDNIPRALAKSKVKQVGAILESKNEKNNDYNYILNVLELKNVLNREVENLSGGELQRFALGMTCVQDANVYMFDEPSSYLDAKIKSCRNH